VIGKAKSVKEYLEALSPERRKVLSKVRSLVKKHMPKGYQETINWGAITYEIPLSRYTNTYNKQPLSYVGIASHKNHYALYLMGATMYPEQLAALKEGFKQAGKKLDMGKACLRFKALEDLPLETIASVIASTTPGQYIHRYEMLRNT
jgi:uncharacterized protein YdhG (YjbR/CyaY superfamily)